MLSANTAWLVTNDQKPPLDDKDFRLAIAYAVNVPDIVNKVYGNIVAGRRPDGPAPDLGASTSTPPRSTRSASATTRRRPSRSSLAAGYKKGGDGFVTNKDGSPIKLTIMVPSGWSDWEAARDVIVASLKAVGINAEAKVADYNGRVNRPQQRQLRPGPQQRGPALEHAVDLLRLHVPPAAHVGRQARTATTAATRTPTPGPWSSSSTRRPVDDVAGHEGDHLQAPEDLAHRHAGHPALVQRALVAGEQRRLDQLAVRRGRARPPGHLERLLADGRHQDAHADLKPVPST